MRSLDSAITAAAAAAVVRRVYFVRLEFDSGTVAWNSSRQSIDLDGHTYLGIGMLGSIAAVKETSGVKSQSVTVRISGLKQEIIALAQSEPFINRKAYIHSTFLDGDNRPLVAAPFLVFKGAIDGLDGEVGQVSAITVTLKSRLADWERQRKIRYTDSDQQRIHPGDRFFEYIPQLSQRKIIWPKAAFLPDPRD